jgi:glycyl-tRNA synthetase beta chain
MPDFLLELRSEEIPARMQAKARDDLARLFAAELTAAGITPGEIVTYATPRRLALIARGLPAETAPVSEEVKGPRTSAPPQALDGFLRKTGLTREQLTERDGVFFAVSERPGRPTAELLAAAIPAIVRAFPWPKSMRWGAASASTESIRWIRPLQGIVAIFGEEVVPVSVAGITSSPTTLGHRFHHPGPITLGGAHDYVEKLRACHVVVDQDERAATIRARAAELAREAGLELVEDEGLVAENAGLTEWPVPLLGRFDEAFLAVPPEVIQLTARVNQKYFVCRGADGRLANAFVCTANIAATDGGAKIVEGNRKVLAARLSDARFFYEQDLKVPLESQAEKLGKIVFHEKLGTVADKVDRVAKLARWLVEEGIVHSSSERGGGPRPQGVVEGGDGAAGAGAPAPLHQPTAGPPSRAGEELGRHELAALAERAARLCKADLVTGMVGEFPELQGLMGGYYAAAQGEHPAVAEAIRDHYKPVGQGDRVPTEPVTVAVSLADKMDNLVTFFTVNEKPTGSRDPFALRRAALGAIELVLRNNIRTRLILIVLAASYRWYLQARLSERREAFSDAYFGLERAGGRAPDFMEVVRLTESRLGEEDRLLLSGHQSVRELIAFFADRLKVQQREAGVRHDLIDAVFALGGEDDLVRLLARVRALQAFMGTEDGANLLAGYKRAANILKKEGWSTPTPLPSGESGRSVPRTDLNRPGDGLPDAGQGASAPRGEGYAHGPSSGHPHPSAASGFSLPLPKGEGKGLSYTPEPEENALRQALDSAEPRAAAAVEAEEFEGAMAALASLRAPIDAFFDKVTVNDPDPVKRAARLDLLARVRDAVHRVADFSRIEG